LLFVSREHFLIERDGESFVLVDRGSTCGTIVGARIVGGNRAGGRALLRHAVEITVGANGSPCVFRFEMPALEHKPTPFGRQPSSPAPDNHPRFVL
jgi:hypothetical protein